MRLPDLLARTVKRYGSRIALTHENTRLSYNQLAAWTNVLSDQLKSLNLSSGARVGLYLENSVEYLAAFWAVAQAGLVIVPLDNSASMETLAYIISDCEVEAVFVSPRFRRKLPDIIKQTKSLKAIICSAGTGLDQASVKSVMMAPMASVTTATTLEIDAESSIDESSLAAIFYTSGSTGQSKGVMLSHKNLVVNTMATNEYLELTEKDSVMVVLPFYYIYGNSLLLTHIAAGARLVVDNRFMYPEVILDTMQAEKVTGFSGVPSNFSILLGKSTLTEREFPHLRYFTQAGGGMAPETIRKLIATFPDTKMFVMYGQTEAAPRVTWLPPDKLKDKLGSIGIPLNGIQVEILNPAGQSAASGETGELVVRGPNVMLGYWNQPEEQEQVLRNGALYTGDLGYKDDDGFLWIVGRSKEIIKSGGNRVSTKEIEDVLLTTEAVLEAAVVGMPDDLLGEAIVAVVSVKPGIILTEKELKKHCQVHLPLHKLPQRFVFVESLPKHGTGKVNKLNLKEQL